jgi:hypothetical protein
MNLEYTVLENGLDFVLSAINNLAIINEGKPDDELMKRLLKYALLHLSSGIELIFKSRLLQEHWTYVFSDMNKANKTAMQSGDFKSVDSETIIERLENLCSIKLDQPERTDLSNLRKKRNKAEHFNFNEHVLSVESSIHKCISVLIKTIVKHYDIESFNDNERYLFSEIRDLMRKLTQHYDDAKSIAQKELEQSGLSDSAFICPECEEKFLIRDDGVKCYFCGYEDNGESAAKSYISNIMGVSEYQTVKEGGEYPLYECPECGNDSFVVDTENEKAICFSCDFECNTHDLSFCSDCGLPYIDSEDGLCLCSSCLEYRFNKDE